MRALTLIGAGSLLSLGVAAMAYWWVDRALGGLKW